MTNIAINQVGLGLFLLLNLAVGLWAGRGVKTMKDYALANRSLGSGVLAMTLIATFIGIEYLQSIDNLANFGLVNTAMPVLFTIIVIFLLSHYVLPKLAFYDGCYTIGEVMFKMYGSFARYFTVCISTVFVVFMVASQLIVVGKFGDLLGISSSQIILVVGFAIILYTFFGGMNSVAATDVLQLLFCTVGFVLLAHIFVYKTGKNVVDIFSLIRDRMPEKMNLFSSKKPFLFHLKGAFFWNFPTFFLTPPYNSASFDS